MIMVTVFISILNHLAQKIERETVTTIISRSTETESCALFLMLFHSNRNEKLRVVFNVILFEQKQKPAVVLNVILSYQKQKAAVVLNV